MLDKKLSKYAPWSIVALRLGVGIVFLVHGLGKLLNVGPSAMPIEGFASFLSSLGVPAASLLAWAVALVEALGGLAILVGFMTRYAALLLSAVMLVALGMVHLSKGFSAGKGGYEYVLMLLLACVSLLLSGPGQKLVLGKKKE
ncbi:MAG: DoxX family protein [Nanoarchaeota archaeon]|mgnify:CR=1 FL=1